MAWVSVPDLGLRPSRQRYEHIVVAVIARSCATPASTAASWANSSETTRGLCFCIPSLPGASLDRRPVTRRSLHAPCGATKKGSTRKRPRSRCPLVVEEHNSQAGKDRTRRGGGDAVTHGACPQASGSVTRCEICPVVSVPGRRRAAGGHATDHSGYGSVSAVARSFAHLVARPRVGAPWKHAGSRARCLARGSTRGSVDRGHR